MFPKKYTEEREKEKKREREKVCVCERERERETEKGEDRERRSSQTTANFRSNGLLRDPIGSQGEEVGGGVVIDKFEEWKQQGQRGGGDVNVVWQEDSTYQGAALSACFSSSRVRTNRDSSKNVTVFSILCPICL